VRGEREREKRGWNVDEEKDVFEDGTYKRPKHKPNWLVLKCTFCLFPFFSLPPVF